MGQTQERHLANYGCSGPTFHRAFSFMQVGKGHVGIDVTCERGECVLDPHILLSAGAGR